MKKCLFPCLRNEEKPDALSFYLGIFFLTTLDCLVSYGPRCEKNCFRWWGGGGGEGVSTKSVSNQSPQLKRLAWKLKFHLQQVYIWYFPKSKKKGADQTVRMRRLVCACVVHKPPEDRVSRVEAHIIAVFMIRAIVNELHPTFFLFCIFKFSSKVHSLLLNSFTFHLFYQAMFG